MTVKFQAAVASMFFAAILVLVQSVHAEDKAMYAEHKADPVLDAMDPTADPCVDFYQYACGGWNKSHPLPTDRAGFNRFNELLEKNYIILKGPLEEAASGGAVRTPNQQKIGDLYASCMDEAKINKLGIAPVMPELARIDAVKTKSELGPLVTWLHEETFPGFFSFYSGQDAKDATKVIAHFDQGGLGLPSKDYYFDTDAKSQDLREKYVAHIARTFVLSGTSSKEAAKMAKAIMGVETSLAKNSLRVIERRDPARVYHIKTLDELQAMVPFISWKDYIVAKGAPSISSLNVVVPEYAQGLQTTINQSSLSDLKAYLRWTILRDASPFLSNTFVDEDFAFFGKMQSGQKEIRPRWIRCSLWVDSLIGEALGQAYVEKAFPPQSKSRVLVLIANLRKAVAQDIDNLPWMGSKTKKQAEAKLSAISQKIGYPDKWRDYSALTIKPDDFLGSIVNAAKFRSQRRFGQIGKPRDKTEWQMAPPAIDGVYDPANNEINFAAGILQPPIFYASADDALNYGAIGVQVAHEILHAFDNQGRQYDALGNQRDWWTPADAKAFSERAQCFIDQYGSYVVAKDAKNGDVKQDGKLTLGENAADNGGVRIAWNALMDYANGKNLPSVDGFTPKQRFFLGFAQVGCANQTDEMSISRAKTNKYSAPRARVNLTLQNMPEFQKAYSCKVGQPMVPKNRCRIW